MRDDRGGDRPKKSWREVDQMRDRSQRRDRDPMEKRSSPAAVNAQKSYRAALERAFEAGTLGELARTLARVEEPRSPAPTPAAPPAPPTATQAAGGAEADPPEGTSAALPPAPPPAPRDPERENRQKMVVKIKEAEGREPISRAVDAFLARYPKLPDDFEVLTKALSHRDDERVRATLAQLAVLVAKEKPRRGRTLVGQLRFLEETHGDPEIRKAAAEVRAKL